MTVPVFRVGVLGRDKVHRVQGARRHHPPVATLYLHGWEWGECCHTLCAARCLPGLTLKALCHSAYMSKWLRWPQWTRRKNFSCFQVAACGEAIGSTLPSNVPLISYLVSG